MFGLIVAIGSAMTMSMVVDMQRFPRDVTVLIGAKRLHGSVRLGRFVTPPEAVRSEEFLDTRGQNSGFVDEVEDGVPAPDGPGECITFLQFGHTYPDLGRMRGTTRCLQHLPQEVRRQHLPFHTLTD